MHYFPNHLLRAAFCIVFLAALAAPSAHAGQEYVVGVPCITPSCSYPEYENLLREAYSRTGNTIDFKRLPMLRDLMEADSGITDASLVRGGISINYYPNLLHVPVPLGSYEISIFTAKPGFTPQFPIDLAGASVGCLRGDLAAMHIAQSAQLGFTTHHDTKTILLMLQRGRLDAVLLPTYTGKVWAEQLGVTELHISRPIYKDFFYHSINRKHSALIPHLSEALQKMYQDGTVKRLLGRHYNRILD